MATKSTVQGRVISAHGRHFLIELQNGETRTCFPRGKKSNASVGDYVLITPSGSEEGTIEKILERKNLLYRSDELRSKQFAANVDQVLIVVATEPTFSDELAGRAIVAAHTANIEPLVILNKVDITHKLEVGRQRLQWVQNLNIPVIELDATNTELTQSTLLPWLKNKTSILLGQSAMGKSTILNALIPTAAATTQEHSKALDAGRHTTTSTRMYHLPDKNGSIIDSPGFQSFGLYHLSGDEIRNGFTEFYANGHSCRFHNCTHRHEPGCNVLNRLEQGLIAPLRYDLYTRLLAEQEQQTHY